MATAATIDVLLRANTASYRASMMEASRVATRQLGQIQREAEKTARVMGQMRTAFAGFFTAQVARSGITALLDTAKAQQALVNSMRASVGSARGSAEALSFVSQAAKELGLDFQSAAQGFQRLSASANANGVSMRDQQRLFLEVSRAATSLQLAPPIVDRAMTALSQSFSKGRFQAEELRQQLAEAVPGVLPRFQKAVMEMVKGTDLAGKSFDDLLQGGLLDVQRFLPAMIKAFEEMGASWKDAAGSLQAETNRLGNAWRELKLNVSGGLFNDAATTSIRLMAENLERVASAATLAGGVLAARVIGGAGQRAFNIAAAPARQRLSEAVNTAMLADMAKARARDAAEQVNQARAAATLNAAWREQSGAATEVARQQMAVAFANNEAAQKTLAHQQGAAALGANLRAQREAAAAAVVAQRRLAQAQANYNAAVASGNVATQQEITLKGRLIAAQEAATVATNNLAAARAREAAAARAGTLAGVVGGAARSAGAGLLALAGGPWGAAVLAIGALGVAYASMMRKAEDARREFEAQVKSLDVLGYSIQDVTDRLGKKSISLTDSVSAWHEQSKEMRDAEERLKGLQAAVDNYRAKIELARTSTREGAGLTIAVDFERLQKAEKELEDFQNKVDPLRQKFIALEEHIKAAVDPALFEQIREAIRNANNEKLEDLKAQIGNVKWAAIEAREAIRKIQTAGQDDMWQRQVGRLRREQGEFRGWLASEAKKYMDATGTTSFGSAWERMTSDQRKAFVAQREFVRQDIAAEKAWEEQKRRSKEAASAAARANDDAAQSMLRSAQARQQEYQLEMEAGDSLSQSRRELLKFELLLRDTKDKYLKASANEIRAVLQANVALEDQIDATRRLHEAKLRALAVDRQIADYQASMAQRHARDLDAIRFGGNTSRWNEIANGISDQFQQQRLGLDRELQDRLATIPIEQMARRNEEQQRYLELIGKTVIAEAEAMAQSRKNFEDLLEAQSNWINGFQRARDNYIAQAQDIASQTESIFTNVFEGLENVMVDFLHKGSANWKGFLDDINRQILQFIVRQQLSKWMQSMFGGDAWSQANGIGSAIQVGNSMMGGSSGNGFMSFMNSLLGRGWKDGAMCGENRKAPPCNQNLHWRGTNEHLQRLDVSGLRDRRDRHQGDQRVRVQQDADTASRRRDPGVSGPARQLLDRIRTDLRFEAGTEVV